MAKRRRPLRLAGYDYKSPGAYFITTFTKNRAHLFGHVDDGVMHLNENGHLVHAAWTDLPRYYPHVALDVFVVMPDHVHGIVNITTPHATHGLPEIVRACKSFSSRRINERRGTPGRALWHRSYHECIIRDLRALGNIRRYISENPLWWDRDHEHRVRAGLRPALTRATE